MTSTNTVTTIKDVKALYDHIRLVVSELPTDTKNGRTLTDKGFIKFDKLVKKYLDTLAAYAESNGKHVNFHLAKFANEDRMLDRNGFKIAQYSNEVHFVAPFNRPLESFKNLARSLNQSVLGLDGVREFKTL